MPRVPLVSDDSDDEIVAEVFETSRREGREPIALYRALANSPAMLRAYSTLARGLRYQAETPRPLREVVILRIAQLVGSEYEWCHHVSMALAAGVSEAKIDAVQRWRDSDVFDAGERAALQLADESHALRVSDDAFSAVEAAFGRSAAVELLLLASFYEAVARLIQGLGLVVEPAYRRDAGVPTPG